MSRKWPLNDAKTHLSAVIDQAQDAPQLITRHGKPVAVVLSVEAFDALSSEQSAWDALRPGQGILEANENFERLPTELRNVIFED